MTNLALEIQNAANTALIDRFMNSQESLRPKLLYNDTHTGNTVLAELEHELQYCDSFWFSVAFVTKSGMIDLKNALAELEKRNIKGRILTTDYLTFNEPDALRELMKFGNLEVRVYTAEDFHTKGYMFTRGDSRTFIVGSSNMTQNALKANKEWNLKVTSMEQGELIGDVEAEFLHMWEQAEILTEEWISEEYEPLYRERKKQRKAKVQRLKSYTLKPNFMQIEATKSLTRLREAKQRRALLISATGTGKTYLSAFDVRNFAPKKMLFLVHREQILKQAMESFKDVLGHELDAGLLSGTHHDYDADYCFQQCKRCQKRVLCADMSHSILIT